MASGIDPSSNSDSKEPYSFFGLEPGASFDEVQKARDKKLSEAGDDPLAKGRIEASYDTLLMVSLKERQLGKVSSAAVNASRRENKKVESAADNGIGVSLLTRLRGVNGSKTDSSSNSFFPQLSLPEGQGLITRLVFGILAIVLLLVSPAGSAELILALSTIGLFISQIRRGRRPLASLGWSVVLLSSGLIIGGLLTASSNSQFELISTISSEQIEALPALLMIWLGTLLLD